jgi:hypothetical protein
MNSVSVLKNEPGKKGGGGVIKEHTKVKIMEEK